MPKHNPKEYIKDNSHMSYIQDQEKNNPNIHRWTEMMYYEYSYYMQINKRAVPIALILYSEEEKKYIYHENLRNVCPRNSFPKYLLVHLQKHEEYRGRSRFGLIRLGKLGNILDSSKCIQLMMMHNGEMIRNNEIYYGRESIISIQECSNTYLELCHSDYRNMMNLKIELCQEDIEKTVIKSKPIGNSPFDGLIPHYANTSFESTLISPQITRNGKTHIFYQSEIRYYPIYELQTNICLFQFENQVPKITDTIEAKNCISELSILLVNQKSNEIFAMNYGGKYHGFYRVSPPTKREHSDFVSPSRIENIPFENYAQYKPYDNDNSVIPCPLTDTKYLIFISSIIERKTTFQKLFSKQTTWLLVDLNERRVKTVYPRVYDLKSPTKFRDDFITVKKKIRGGRKGIDNLFPDGDLNGGYSDPVLLNDIKPKNNHLKDFSDGSFVPFEPIDQKPTSLIPIPKPCNISSFKLISFRPFHENPELFQVHLTVPESNVILVPTGPTDKTIDTHGYSFKFYFKFRDEATCKYSRLLTLSKETHFSDISIKTH